MKPSEVPVVLIHGVGLDHSMWLPVMSALPHRRTVAYDMIGHGGAEKPTGPYNLQTFVDQLTNVVKALDCEVDLVGFSMGALVAQGYAASVTEQSTSAFTTPQNSESLRFVRNCTFGLSASFVIRCEVSWRMRAST